METALVAGIVAGIASGFLFSAGFGVRFDVNRWLEWREQKRGEHIELGQARTELGQARPVIVREPRVQSECNHDWVHRITGNGNGPIWDDAYCWECRLQKSEKLTKVSETLERPTILVPVAMVNELRDTYRDISNKNS